MAVKPATMVINENGTAVVTWANLDNGDTGAPVDVSRWPELSVQKTAGAGTIALQGSNDNSTWGALGAGIAPDGTIKRVPEHPLYLRPSATVADDNTVVLVAGGHV